MKSSIFCCFLLLFFISFLSSQVVETASFSQFFYGIAPECEYDNWISHTVKKIAIPGYNTHAPFYRYHVDHPFGNYQPASDLDLIYWNEVVASFLQGNLTEATEMIAIFGFPYTVIEFHDTDTGRMYYMLRENLNMDLYDDQGTPEETDDVHGGFDFGWGLYVFCPEAETPIIINIPHPSDDFIVPPLAVKAFQDWNARYLIYAGASREALHQQGNYTNDRSLSDPSRHSAHPFNRFYIAASDEIGNTLGIKEFSAQLHSYDWNRASHAGVANIQISAGPSMTYPTLPIRDFSSRRMDIVNQTDFLVFPENSVGVHPPVYINDYYTVFYSEGLEPFYFDDGVNRVRVNNYVTATGAPTNVQFLHTNHGRNIYDVFSNFFHIEFDELPNCYPHTISNYHWFYGYDLQTETFNIPRRYDNALAYYGKFIENMTIVLNEALALNDNLLPAPPTNLRLTNININRATIEWDPVDVYDFYTYEAYISTNPEDPFAQVVDRADVPIMASSRAKNLTITGLQTGATYFVRIKTIDYQGNISGFSDEISFTTSLVSYSNLSSRTIDLTTTLRWTASGQDIVHGYKIFRTQGNAQPQMIADWNSHQELLKTTNSQSYIFDDVSDDYFVDYTYKIVMVDTTMTEYMLYDNLTGHPRPTYKIILSDVANQFIDEVLIGYHPLTTDGQDAFYDVIKSGTNPGVHLEIFKSSWGQQGTSLSREYVAEYDVNSEVKSFRLRLRSTHQNLKIRVVAPHLQNEKVVLINRQNNENVNLLQGEYLFQVTDNNLKNFDLYIGDVIPVTSISSSVNRLFTQGDLLIFDYSSTFRLLVEQYNISLVSETDSIILAQGLAPTSLTFNYAIPENVTMHNAKIAIDTQIIDGRTFRYYSSSSFGILPNNTSISINEGYNFLSNPYPQNTLSLSEIAPETDLYVFSEENGWSTANQLYFGIGYMLDSPIAHTLEYNHTFQKMPINKYITGGWNLVANPFLCDMSIWDINFYHNEVLYTYAELYYRQILLPHVRVIRDGISQNSETILAGESFMLYIDFPTYNGLIAQFIPYNRNTAISPVVMDYKGILTAKFIDDERITDEMIITASNSNINANFEHYYHHLEPIKLPNNMSFYLFESLESNRKYNSRTINKLSETIEDFTLIPFTLELPDLATITFTCENIINNLNYRILLVIDEIEYPLFNNNIVNYTPTELSVSGYVKVINEHVIVPTADIVQPANKFVVYPNPFNPSTTISFVVGADLSVRPTDGVQTHRFAPTNGYRVQINIYNIRGQKVKTLFDDFKSSGQHSVTWNGVDQYNKRVSSGVYFVRLNIEGNAPQVKKIMLLK